MADKLMRAQVILTKDSFLPADNVMNTFYFDGDDGATDEAYHDVVFTALQTFYSAVDQLMASTLSGVGTVKIYDMRDPLPRVPEFVGELSLSPGGGDPLPDECACCVSFMADTPSGGNPRTHRGRIYLGPLDQDIGAIVENAYRIQTTHIETIATAAHGLAQPHTLDVIGSVRWSVYSPKIDSTDTIDNAFNDVTHGFVDNAFDTQRRRGVKATTRTTFTD